MFWDLFEFVRKCSCPSLEGKKNGCRFESLRQKAIFAVIRTHLLLMIYEVVLIMQIKLL